MKEFRPCDSNPTILVAIKRLSFVMWDRCTGDQNSGQLFGWCPHYSLIDGAWIKHKTQQDFVLMWFDEGLVYAYMTSSAYYSKKICRLLDFKSEHVDCKRVEHMFPEVENCIQLPAQESPVPQIETR